MEPDAPVTDPADFVGQVSLVRRIYSRIGAERPQSVAVIGGSKSGKTSLLYHLAHPQVAAQYLRDSRSYVFFSFRAVREMTDDPHSFLDAFAKWVSPSAAGTTNRYEGLRARIEELHDAGRRLVVFLDDFQFITSNERFPLEFFSFLRSMANNYNLAYVTTSFLELQTMCIVKEVQESPFFNIFTNLHLGMLSPAEARALLSRVASCTEAAAERLVGWCGCSPYVVKRAGVVVEAGKIPDGASDEDMERVLLPALSPFFEGVISFLPAAAAKPLAAVSRGNLPPPSEAHLLSSLIKQGFLLEAADKIVPSSPAFALFLRKGFSPRMLRGSC
jgi:hypothetical protein